jgi:hypothetical protein
MTNSDLYLRFATQETQKQTSAKTYMLTLAAGLWFSSGTPVSSANKTDRFYITEVLLKVALNTITLTL